jgi:hypothetical protein
VPCNAWDGYKAGLESLVQESIQEYQDIYGTPKSLVIHSHKRTGAREVRAVKASIDSLRLDIPYALLHPNSDSGYFPFVHRRQIGPCRRVYRSTWDEDRR